MFLLVLSLSLLLLFLSLLSSDIANFVIILFDIYFVWLHTAVTIPICIVAFITSSFLFLLELLSLSSLLCFLILDVADVARLISAVIYR